MASQPPVPEPRRARPPHDFEATYSTETPAWDIGRPQPAFQRLAEAGGFTGKVLDVGCGTGEHALLAASLGLGALGVDIAPTAIELARAKAAARGLDVRFLVFDALRLSVLGERFDTVLDCGLFHGFEDEERTLFVASLAGVVSAGGRYHMLCFSERQLGSWGPRRVTQDEIQACFTHGWVVDSIEPTVLELTIEHGRIAQAWLVGATRV